MKAFVVRSEDGFDRKKNPGLKLSVKSILENPQIPKYCCQCAAQLEILKIYEHDKENTMLFCFRCRNHKRKWGENITDEEPKPKRGDKGRH
jgi:hypothetical protein